MSKSVRNCFEKTQTFQVYNPSRFSVENTVEIIMLPDTHAHMNDGLLSILQLFSSSELAKMTFYPHVHVHIQVHTVVCAQGMADDWIRTYRTYILKLFDLHISLSMHLCIV